MIYKITSKYENKEIENNGSLTDPVWEKSDPVALKLYTGEPAPDFLETHVRSFWTDQNLYISFEAKFDAVRTSPKDVKSDSLGKTMDLWDLSDVFEIFIGPSAKNSKKYRELQVAPDNRWIDLTLDASGKERLADFKWTSGMTAKSKVDNSKKIWTAVFKIPLTAFDEFPKNGSVWNCNFYRIHGDTIKAYLSWAPVGVIRFHQPDKFGEIIFIK